MNIGEIGCFLSHRSVWKKIVAQNLTAGIIFEDDVQIDPNVFSDSLKSSLGLGIYSFPFFLISARILVALISFSSGSRTR